ncbi:hypothetical protein QBC47DRAFT_371192 [Echria macrotheca]|uniref:CFEM domain-containing protein n=1 Tax=Echria macrotheca TaxID=438768 RepID=A0AAJ0BL27_9PEZI|nr:hypothetical protein QBC47DRAFT_371192 [Echria macrotheca]
MKVTSILASLALATFAAAQSPTLPSCAQDCANPYLTNGIGNCGTDPKCICGNGDFIVGISCCLANKCPVSDQSAAVNFASQFCSAAGVTTLPTTVSCASTAVSTNSGATTTGASSGGSTTPTVTGAGTASPGSTGTSSHNLGPRQTAAAAGFGAIGGIMAAVAML